MLAFIWLNTNRNTLYPVVSPQTLLNTIYRYIQEVFTENRLNGSALNVRSVKTKTTILKRLTFTEPSLGICPFFAGL